jgi:hypothetical protein
MIERFWRPTNFSAITRGCARESESPTKYPVVVRIEDDRNFYGKLRSLRAKWEKAESGSPQLSFIAAH